MENGHNSLETANSPSENLNTNFINQEMGQIAMSAEGLKNETASEEKPEAASTELEKQNEKIDYLIQSINGLKDAIESYTQKIDTLLNKLVSEKSDPYAAYRPETREYFYRPYEVERNPKDIIGFIPNRYIEIGEDGVYRPKTHWNPIFEKPTYRPSSAFVPIENLRVNSSYRPYHNKQFWTDNIIGFKPVHKVERGEDGQYRPSLAVYGYEPVFEPQEEYRPEFRQPEDFIPINEILSSIDDKYRPALEAPDNTSVNNDPYAAYRQTAEAQTYSYRPFEQNDSDPYAAYRAE